MLAEQPSTRNLTTILVEKPQPSSLGGNDASLIKPTPHMPLKASLVEILATPKLGLKRSLLVVIATHSEVWGVVILVAIRPPPSDQGVLVASLFQVGYGGESLEVARINYLSPLVSLFIVKLLRGRSTYLKVLGAYWRFSLHGTPAFNNSCILPGINIPFNIVQDQNAQICAEASRAVIKPTRENRRTDTHAKPTISDLIRLVFNWDEINTTAASIRDFICACLACAENHVDELGQMVEQRLDSFEKAITSTLKPAERRVASTVRLRQPSIAEADTGLSQPGVSTLPNNMTPCIDSIGKTTANVHHFLLRTLRETNSLSIDNVTSSGKRVAGFALGVLCQRSKATVHSRFTKAMTGLLASLRIALFTPIANWKVVGSLARNQGWNVNPLDIVTCVLAFLINVASVLVEGGPPGHIAAFDYKTSINSNLGDSASIAAFADIRDYIGISISAIKAMQVPTDIFAETEIPVFGWGEFILAIITLSLQFPRNRAAPGYNRRIMLFACWANEAIVYHALLFLNLGHVLVSSRILAAAQMATGMFGFTIMVFMHWGDLCAQQENATKAKQIIYLNLCSSTFGTVAGLAGKLGIVMPDPSTRALCAVLAAVANKGNSIVQATIRVRRK